MLFVSPVGILGTALRLAVAAGYSQQPVSLKRGRALLRRRTCMNTLGAAVGTNANNIRLFSLVTRRDVSEGVVE